MKYLIFLILLSGCTAFQIPSSDLSELAYFNNEKLESKDFLLGENSSVLLNLFIKNDKVKDKITTDKNDTVRIKLINDRLIKLNLITADTILVKEIKGRKFDHEFKVNNRFSVGGVPPLLWGIGSSSNSFSVKESGELVLYHNHGGVLMVAIIPIFGTSTGINRNKYILANGKK